MKLIPESNYKDIYDRARFELTWVVTAATFISMIIFSIVALIFTPQLAPVSILAIILTFLLLLNLFQRRKFKRTAIGFLVLGVIVSIYQLYAVSEVLHLVDLIWFFVIIMFGFFTLGMAWGIIATGTYIISIIIFILFFVNKNITNVGQVSSNEMITMTINAILAGILLFYVVYKFHNTHKHAEIEYHFINENLSEKNELIKKKNEANEIMLKEIHHRVKNNLQIITSLLRLQSREIESAETEFHFREAIDRVSAMAMIHEKLYQEDLSKVELDNYIHSLVQSLIGNYAVDKEKVHYKVNVGQVSIDIQKIVPLALILNELVSNSLKHGDNREQDIELSIDLSMLDNSIFLNYHDNGTWKDESGKKSFGLQLIDVLCSQLDGEYNLEKEHEINYTFTFKV
ncbi:MAG: sensor histidine kinase [Crocinitomicaceae bacterium]